MSYRFKRSESVRAGFCRIATDECDRFCADLAGRNDADVHEARKRCKMLRALLRLVRGALDRADFIALNRELRDIARRLGPARDAEVLRETLARLLAARGPSDARRFSSVARTLDAQAHAARRHTLSAPALQAITFRMIGVREHLHALDLREHGWAALDRGLRRAYARARRPLRDGAPPTAATRHAWRKEVKTLWYHVRLLAAVRSKKMSAFEKRLDSLGELLGGDRDLALLATHLRTRLLRTASARLREPLFALINARRASLFRDAREHAATLFEEKPRAFTRRIETWWRAWRK